eukprot:SAG11_NODE_6804_length_1245_cov_1.242583_1_plen_211_part_00
MARQRLCRGARLRARKSQLLQLRNILVCDRPYLRPCHESWGVVLERSQEVRQSTISSDGYGTRGASPGFYEVERQVHFTPGTCLFYRFDTFHRVSACSTRQDYSFPAFLCGHSRLRQGTPVVHRACRRIHSIVYRREDCPWIQWDVWAKHFGPLWTSFVPKLSVWQRNVLGFPKPGASYWNTPQAFELVADRYPGIDLSEYEAAAGSAKL